MGDYRVNKADKKEGVVQVGCHLAALGDGSSDNTGESTGKGKLEEPAFQLDVSL
jgi:hypothetical protein